MFRRLVMLYLQYAFEYHFACAHTCSMGFNSQWNSLCVFQAQLFCELETQEQTERNLVVCVTKISIMWSTSDFMLKSRSKVGSAASSSVSIASSVIASSLANSTGSSYSTLVPLRSLRTSISAALAELSPDFRIRFFALALSRLKSSCFFLIDFGAIAPEVEKSNKLGKHVFVANSRQIAYDVTYPQIF